MKKKLASRCAFFTARFLISFAFCVAGLMLALLSYAVNSEPAALAPQNQSIAPVPAQQSVNGVPVLQAIPSQEPDAPGEAAPAIPLPESGQIDLAALGIHPLPFPLLPKAWANNGPDSAAVGTNAAYMQTTSDIVNQNTVAAFAALSTGWQPGETVAISLNGGTPTNFIVNSFGSGTPIGYLGITISTGSGFGYITIDAVGNTSGRRTGAVVQIAPTGPYLPGVAAAPHAENTAGTSPQILVYGTRYPLNSTVTRYRNGVSQGTSATGSLGTFFIATAALANNGNTSAVFSADSTAVVGAINGSSEEERSDAGGPQAGDQNTARAFVDRAVLNSTTGGSFAVVGEGFNPGETVNITTCAAGSVTADANGAASFFVTAAPGAAVYNCVLTGATSGRVGRASVLAHTNATNRRGLIVAPSSVSSGGMVTVLADKLPANDTANVYLDGVLQGTATSNSDGLATFNLTIPTSGFVHEVGWINTNGTGDAQATVLLLINGGGPTPTPPPPTPIPTPTPNPTPTVTPPPTVCSFAEGMDNVTTLGNPKGWYEQNNSTLPAGSTSWFQGNTAVFTAQGQCPPSTSYIGASFNNTGGTTGSEIISNWLEIPPVTLQNGGILTFWTRTVSAPAFPDRLQVRMSTNGNSSNVGSTPTSVGDFTTLLLDINPTYQTTGAGSYPNNWTQFNITLSGLGSPAKGRLAFRYFVENAGPGGVNSDYIGIDTVTYTCAGPSPTPVCFFPTATPGETTPPPFTPGCQILYDQTNAAAVNATNSQDFETVNDAFDNQTADDFVVPAGQTWTIQSVFADGVYFNGSGPMQSVNLYFYSDSGGFPGTSVGTYLNTPLLSDSSGSIQVVVPGGGITLPSGIYWVSVQARMDFSTGGQWGWTDRTTVSNNAAAWQNPGGGFAAGCATWGRRGATCGIDTTAPDQIFRLRGCPMGDIGLPISGRVGNCASPAPTATPPATPTPPTLPAVPNVLMTLTGSSSGTTLTDGSGNYSFFVVPGGSYTVTPSKGPLASGSAGINSVDVLAIQRHFLGLTLIPTGCRLTAADAVTNGGIINSQDILAVQRFFLGFTSGTGSCGQYKFTPANRSYPSIAGPHTGQDYSMYVVGDVAAPFTNRPQGVLPDLPERKSEDF